MLRSAIADAVVPVTIEHGPITITLQARLEAISAQNDAYKALLQAEFEARVDDIECAGKVVALLKPEVFAERIYGPVVPTAKAGKESRPPTEKEIEKRSEEWRAEIKTASEAQEKANAAHTGAKCNRIAYLVPQWDVTEMAEGIEIMLPVTGANLASFNPQITTKIIEAVEAAVLGPLPTSGSSAG